MNKKSAEEVGKNEEVKLNSKSSFSGAIIFVVFLIFLFFYLKRRDDRNTSMEANKSFIEAETYDCYRQAKSSGYIVKYQFEYKGTIYKGSAGFDKYKLGNICNGFRFLAQFDTTDPTNNFIMLDSLRYSPDTK